METYLLKYCLFYKELVEKIFLKTTFFKFVFFYYNNWEIYVKILSDFYYL